MPLPSVEFRSREQTEQPYGITTMIILAFQFLQLFLILFYVWLYVMPYGGQLDVSIITE